MARVVEIANPVIDVGSEPAVFESSTTRVTGPSATGGTARGRQFVQARTTDLSGARKLFTTYRTAQYVVIEDVSLAVIFRLIQFMVLVYAIMMLLYSLYWHEYNVLQDVALFTNQFAKMQPFTGDAEDFCKDAGKFG